MGKCTGRILTNYSLSSFSIFIFGRKNHCRERNHLYVPVFPMLNILNLRASRTSSCVEIVEMEVYRLITNNNKHHLKFRIEMSLLFFFTGNCTLTSHFGYFQNVQMICCTSGIVTVTTTWTFTIQQQTGNNQIAFIHEKHPNPIPCTIMLSYRKKLVSMYSPTDLCSYWLEHKVKV